MDRIKGWAAFGALVLLLAGVSLVDLPGLGRPASAATRLVADRPTPPTGENDQNVSAEDLCGDAPAINLHIDAGKKQSIINGQSVDVQPELNAPCQIGVRVAAGVHAERITDGSA
jgi:hypothetical protein